MQQLKQAASQQLAEINKYEALKSVDNDDLFAAGVGFAKWLTGYDSVQKDSPNKWYRVFDLLKRQMLERREYVAANIMVPHLIQLAEEKRATLNASNDLAEKINKLQDEFESLRSSKKNQVLGFKLADVVKKYADEKAKEKENRRETKEVQSLAAGEYWKLAYESYKEILKISKDIKQIVNQKTGYENTEVLQFKWTGDHADDLRKAQQSRQGFASELAKITKAIRNAKGKEPDLSDVIDKQAFTLLAGVVFPWRAVFDESDTAGPSEGSKYSEDYSAAMDKVKALYGDSAEFQKLIDKGVGLYKEKDFLMLDQASSFEVKFLYESLANTFETGDITLKWTTDPKCAITPDEKGLAVKIAPNRLEPVNVTVVFVQGGVKKAKALIKVIVPVKAPDDFLALVLKPTVPKPDEIIGADASIPLRFIGGDSKFHYKWSGANCKVDDFDKSNTAVTAPASGEASVTVSLLIEGKDSKSSALASKTVKFSVSAASSVKVTISGPKQAKAGDKVALKAVVEAGKNPPPNIRFVWSESTTPLGEGNSISYSTRESKTCKIKVKVIGKRDGEDVVLAEATHQLEVVKEEKPDKKQEPVKKKEDPNTPKVTATIKLPPGPYIYGSRGKISVDISGLEAFAPKAQSAPAPEPKPREDVVEAVGRWELLPDTNIYPFNISDNIRDKYKLSQSIDTGSYTFTEGSKGTTTIKWSGIPLMSEPGGSPAIEVQQSVPNGSKIFQPRLHILMKYKDTSFMEMAASSDGTQTTTGDITSWATRVPIQFGQAPTNSIFRTCRLVFDVQVNEVNELRTAAGGTVIFYYRYVKSLNPFDHTVVDLGDSAPAKTTSSVPIKVIWNSDPQLQFEPVETTSPNTALLFNRMGKVKIWAYIQILQDGLYQTVGETPQEEVNVVAPNFEIVYNPVQGKGQVGQEIKATVKTEPVIEDSLINYFWTSPESSNRMQYQTNAGVIGFKLKDANPLDLVCTAKIPTIGEVIGTVKGIFSASPYNVKAQVVGTSGPKPKIWKEGVGLVEIDKGSYASDERVRVKATIEGDPLPSELHWKWTVNEGTTIAGGATSQEATITRYETGTAEATVEATDKDGVFLGKATATFQVTVSADDLKKKQKVQLNVVLQAPRIEIGLKESLNVTATATGGKAPYQFVWQGVTKPNGSAATLTAAKLGKNTLAVTATDSNGATGSASIVVEVYDPDLRLKLESDKAEIVVFDTANLSATVTGGKPPYVVKWGLGVKGAGNKATFCPTAIGNLNATATVTDAKNKTASALVSIKVLPIKLIIEGLPKTTVFGKQVQVKAVADPIPAGKNPVYFWNTDVPVRIGKASSNSPENSFCMNVMGVATIHVEMTAGNTVVASSPDYKVEVTAPKVTLSLSPSKPKVGDTVTVSAALTEEVDAKSVRWNWSPLKDATVNGSSMTFKLKDALPVNVLVVLANAGNGQKLAQASMEVSAGKSGNKEPDGKNGQKSSGAPKPETVTEQIKDGKFQEAQDNIEKLKQISSIDAASLQQQWLDTIGASIDSDTENAQFDQAEKNLELGNQVSATGVRYSTRSEKLKKVREQWDYLQTLDEQMQNDLKTTNMPDADEVVRGLNAFKNTTLLRGDKPAALYDSIMKIYVDKLKRYRYMIDVTYRDDITKWNSHGDHGKTVERSNNLLKLGLYPIDCKFINEQRDKASQLLKQQQAKKSTVIAKQKAKSVVKKKKVALKGTSDSLSSVLDAVNAPLKTTDKEEPKPKTSVVDNPTSDLGKPVKVVSSLNTGNCQFTDTAKFTLDKAVHVTQILVWYCWNAGEDSVTYTLYQDNEEIRSGKLRKGDSDIYQKQWGNGVDEPRIDLPAGTYTIKVMKKQIGQNSESGGNGMITVVTGGYLLPPSSNSSDSLVLTEKKQKPVIVSKPQIKRQPAPKPVAKPTPKMPSDMKPGTKIGDVAINPKDGAEMVWVPAGEFLMGSNGGDREEKPQHNVYLDGYWMYKYEVTVAQYKKFCSETSKQMPTAPDWGWIDNHPIVNVNLWDAFRYAKWAGASLPTEAQWEKAARGTDGREYPWGNQYDNLKLNAGIKAKGPKQTQPVGSYPAGASPYGCMDMAGNVAEWCSDRYWTDYYKSSPYRNPSGPASVPSYNVSGAIPRDRVTRGGGWDDSSDNYRCACRGFIHDPDYGSDYGGFRLVR